MKNKGIKLTQLRELFPLQADNADCFNIMIMVSWVLPIFFFLEQFQ